MKSPCLDRGDGLPCKLVNEDKNNEECENCKARLMYVNAIDRSPSSSMPMEVIKEARGQKMDEKKPCTRCGKNSVINKYAKYCSPCLNVFRWEKKAAEAPESKKTGTDKATPLKLKKTANQPAAKEPQGPAKKNAAPSMPGPGKAPKSDDTAVMVQFGKYISVYKEVEKLADQEMRPVGLQVAYMLKKQLETHANKEMTS